MICLRLHKSVIVEEVVEFSDSEDSEIKTKDKVCKLSSFEPWSLFCCSEVYIGSVILYVFLWGCLMEIGMS